MKPNLLAYRYAKAFFELSAQNNAVDKSLEDLLLVKTTIEGNKELNILIHEPFVSKEKKVNVLQRLFKESVSKITLDLLNLLIMKNRDSVITNIYDEFYVLYLDYKKIALVKVTSAVELDEHTSNRIVNILKHKIVKKDTIQIENVIDKSIIGGFKVKYMDYEYDASVVNTLKRLQSSFEENLFVKGF